MNDLLRCRQEIGYKKDFVLNIDVNTKNENLVYDLTTKRLTKQANYFDSYISEDYRHSMALLSKWERLDQNVEVVVKELQNLANDMFTTMSRLVSLDYKYSQQQKYGRFLYYLSPPTWRLHNREFARSVEIEAKGFDYGDSQDDDTFTVVFDKLRNICFGKPVNPVLYFTRPEDLIEVFDAMESQQLHYLTHVTHLTPYIKNLKVGFQNLKDIITMESTSVLNSIKLFESHLDFYEARCTHLKNKFYNILHGMFYDSVGTIDVLKLKLHLEFCFEKVLLQKPTNMDIVCIAKHIEKFYMDYSYRLDNIHSETVRRAISKYQEKEKQRLLRGKKATKELRLFNRLEKQLLNVYGLADTDVRKKSDNLLNKSKTTKTRPQYNSTDITKPESLTDDEIEYLKLFTD
ncbi:unnamed protein product [Leptosia nina]|uniref:Uncharacterized protein n=1 Tax=Leptosia nina TaxID=320188 RepID=A0AAV1K545_9NEOP